jgi:DNA invertase Pin-like site-specific DNA recombinase
MVKLSKTNGGSFSGALGFGPSMPRPGCRIGGYYRVSTDEQGESIDVQREHIQGFAKRCRGKLVFEASDISSGLRWRMRDGYLLLKKWVRAEEVDAIAARDTTRFGRNPAELSNLFDLCRQHGVEMWDLQIGLLSEMHIWCMGMMAKMQVSTGRGQSHLALLSKAMRGLRAGGTIYGYDCVVVKGEKGHVKRNKVEAPRVKMMFDWVDKDGLGPHAIALILNSRKIPSPPRRQVVEKDRALHPEKPVLLRFDQVEYT